MDPPFDSLPRELVTEVFGRVAVSSYTDLYNVKLCCKNFREVAEEDCIHQQVSLERFPVVRWVKKEQFSKFFDKCIRSKNPDALFRKGVVDYFEGNNPNNALECLGEASRSGHAAASYALAIVSLFEGGESKKKGMKLLTDMKKSRIKQKKKKKTRIDLEHCRKRLMNIIDRVWVKNRAILDQGRVICCTLHRRRSDGWDCSNVRIVEDDDRIVCDGCSCDREIQPIFYAFHKIVH